VGADLWFKRVSPRHEAEPESVFDHRETAAGWSLSL
jgi:hypothetical protein